MRQGEGRVWGWLVVGADFFVFSVIHLPARLERAGRSLQFVGTERLVPWVVRAFETGGSSPAASVTTALGLGFSLGGLATQRGEVGGELELPPPPAPCKHRLSQGIVFKETRAAGIHFPYAPLNSQVPTREAAGPCPTTSSCRELPSHLLSAFLH